MYPTIGTGRALLRERGAAASAYPAGMVARWTLDDTGGLVDLIGGLTFTPSGTVGSAAGVIGEARSFAGAGYLAAADASGIGKIQAGFAVEWWYKQNSTSGVQIIVAKSASSRGWYAYYNGGYLIFQADNDAGTARTAGIYPIAQTTWTHIAFVAGSDGYIRGYKNGVLNVTSASALTGTYDAGAAVNITVGGYAAGLRATCDADELAVYQFGASGDPGAAYWLARYNSGAGRRP